MSKNRIIRKVAVLLLSTGIFTSSLPVFASKPESGNSGMANTQSNTMTYKEGEVIVKYKSGRNAQNLEQIRTKYNLKEKKNLVKSTTRLVTFDPTSSVNQVIKDLKASGQVEYAEPNYVRKLTDVTDDYYDIQWGMKNIGQSINNIQGTPGIDIGIEYAWSQTKGNPNVVVGVIDSGIDINHPDLKNQIWKNSEEIAGDGIDNDHNGYIDDVNGWDFTNHDQTIFDPVDDEEHGTHVAGTIAATNNTIGVVGVAPNVKIMPLKILGSDGGSLADELEAIAYAKAKGVKIINMSIGGYGFSQAEYDAIQNTNALFVVAAGNEGANNDSNDPSYPASYDLSNILSVAAIDNIGNMPWWSNYGATSVDIAAPGKNIVSTTPGNHYKFNSGTSMATPYVTGTAALLLSKNQTYSPLTIKSFILYYSTPLSSLTGLVKSGAMLSAGKALKAISFTDLQNNQWAQEAVETMARLGIIHGVGNNKFDPNSNVTRAEFASLMVKTLGISGTATNSFKDVKTSDWFANNVALAVKNNLVYGISKTEFAPNRPITRQEMAVMMVRAINYKQKVTAKNVQGTLRPFRDQGLIESWAKEGVAISIEQGLIYGMTETTFSPKTNASRAQAAVILYRFYQNFVE